jgi:hypothetical protein
METKNSEESMIKRGCSEINNENTEDSLFREEEIQSLFDKTIKKCYTEEILNELVNEENKMTLEFFAGTEMDCIRTLNNLYKNNEKKKFFKDLIYETIFEIFKTYKGIKKKTMEIIEKIDKFNTNYFKGSEDESKEKYIAKLKKELCCNMIPKFLIREKLKLIKHLIAMRNYEKNLNETIETDLSIKNLIYFYNSICFLKNEEYPLLSDSDKIFQLTEITFPFDNILNNNDQNHNLYFKKLLFQIFILSNAQIIKTNNYVRIIFENNYPKILSIFSQSYPINHIYQHFIFIPVNQVNENLQLNIQILENYIKTNEQYYFIIASFFYLITNEIKDIEDNHIHNKYKFNFLLDNTIHNLQKYSKQIKFDIKSMIAYLDYYQIKEYPKKINNLFNFLNIEKKFKDKTIPKLIEQRFENLIKKIKEMYSSNTNLIPLLINKLINFLTPKIDEITREKLELIPYSKNYYSSEITILISGFGAESDNHSKLWKNLISSNRRSMFYFYQWPGDSFIKIIIKSLPNKIPLINGIQIFDSSISNVFLSAKKRAKISGKILGLILSTKKFFDNCQINLIGFSLGTHVIKNCIKELYNLKIENNIINNVMFIAGATHIEQMKWNNIFNEVINGRIINCYSKNDYVLKYLFQSCVEKKPIGWDKLIVGDENNIKIENYDMSDLKLGHTDYRNRFEDVLKIVDL